MYKVITEIADKTTCYCMVVIQTKEGKFTGFSRLHPYDEFSSFVGIRFAQKRAVAAWCRHKAKIARIQLQTVLNLKKDFLYKKESVPKSLKIKIRDYSKDVEYWTESANTLEQSIYKEDKKRADILARYSHSEQVN